MTKQQETSPMQLMILPAAVIICLRPFTFAVRMAGPTSVWVQPLSIKPQTDCPLTEIFIRGTTTPLKPLGSLLAPAKPLVRFP